MTLWLEIGMFILSVAGIAVACIHFGKQQKLNFFARYTERYQHIIEQLPEYVYTNQTLTEEEFDKISPIIRAYFDLCSEEFFLYEQHHLNKKVWKEWKEGMVAMFQRPVFKQCWERINQNNTCYDHFVQFVQREINSINNN